MHFSNRRSIRLPQYNYSLPGMYGITICTHNKRCLFGSIENNVMALNAIGEIIYQQWISIPIRFASIILDAFVIMPNHIHGIIHIVPKHPIYPRYCLYHPKHLVHSRYCSYHPVGATLVVARDAGNTDIDGGTIARDAGNTDIDGGTIARDAGNTDIIGLILNNDIENVTTMKCGEIREQSATWATTNVWGQSATRATTRVAPTEQLGRSGHMPTIGQIIGAFKSLCVREIKQSAIMIGKLWQRNFYEHIIRNKRDLHRMRQYINNNPLRWGLKK